MGAIPFMAAANPRFAGPGLGTVVPGRLLIGVATGCEMMDGLCGPAHERASAETNQARRHGLSPLSARIGRRRSSLRRDEDLLSVAPDLVCREGAKAVLENMLR